MLLKSLAGAVAILAFASSLATAQSPGVKGWTPKAPGAVGVTPPPPPPPDSPAPKTITRGADDPPPAPPTAAPPAGPSGPVLGGGGAAPPSGGGFDGLLLASNPQGLAGAMQDAGYRAQLTTDDDGNPKIVGSASRSTYWILFLDCESSDGCLGVEFYVSYDMDDLPDLEELNRFNNDFRYIRASLSQWDQPTMYMDVLMRDGGISQDAFLEYVRLWHAIVPEFETAIGF